MNEFTCGIILESSLGWLLVHSKDSPKWDIPKGKMDYGESPLDTALRECQEETGFDLSDYHPKMVDLGALPYHRKKNPTRQLHLFHLKLDNAFALSNDSFCFQATPEVDEIAWIPTIKLPFYLGKKLFNHLNSRNLLHENFT